jgi:pyruvate,orthophosphate dikinase
MNVSEHWGTAVMLMEMVPANGLGAGASVFFTRKPGNGTVEVHGETKEMATGDDLVSGRLANRPLCRDQAGEGTTSLEESDPGLFALHQDLAVKIEQAMGGLPQEVEVAYVTNADGQRVLYTLQARRMEFLRGYTRRFDDVCSMEENIIGRGIGVHGGALSGVASFAASRDAVRALREQSGMPVILLRRTASTDDVALMGELGGLITAAGGVTSHAAVLAQKFGLAAVVGCPDLKIQAGREGGEAALIGTHAVQEGDLISMDGSTGLLYAGTCMPAPSSS